MSMALQLAEEADQCGEVPVGAVIGIVPASFNYLVKLLLHLLNGLVLPHNFAAAQTERAADKSKQASSNQINSCLQTHGYMNKCRNNGNPRW